MLGEEVRSLLRPVTLAQRHGISLSKSLRRRLVPTWLQQSVHALGVKGYG